MRHMPAKNMRNAVGVVANQGQKFWFNNASWHLPTFDTADDFIFKLTKDGSLAGNAIVMNILAGGPAQVSLRTVQRHFLQTTGLTLQHMRLIARANEAVTQLQHGEPILRVAYNLGFADQAHLTRVVKQVSGCTPGDIVKKVEACRLRSIYAYGVCGEMRVQNIKGD